MNKPAPRVLQDHQVLIADDHPLFRNALRYALLGMTNKFIAEAENFAQTCQVLTETPQLDLVFLDINMPDVKGLEGLVTLLNEYPGRQVIMISAHEEPEIINKALSLGAIGFIPKSTQLEALHTSINEILNGTSTPPPEVPTVSEDADFIQKLQLLTPHQLKVLQHMADGLLNKQIAYTMDISESTVKQHASAVLKKLGLINRTQAGVIYKQYLDVNTSIEQPESNGRL
jgi:DNA-binding NarL/FixJ family response regulator